MPLTYYRSRFDEHYWSDLWNTQSLEWLLAVARYDVLTSHLENHLPAQGSVLEGGCGLGQYVVYLRARGHRVIGGDFSPAALQIHRQAYPDSPLLGLDLRKMPFTDDAFQAHISLGVVEHLEDGPHEILRELYRTLAPGGTLLLSVPWVNGARRLLASLIRHHQARRLAAGATFYQYAFTRRELRRVLTTSGFVVRAFYPYSPGKGGREILGLLKPTTSSHTSAPVRAQRRGSLLRHLIYTPPLLWSFAHMILVVAKKPGPGRRCDPDACGYSRKGDDEPNE